MSQRARAFQYARFGAEFMAAVSSIHDERDVAPWLWLANDFAVNRGPRILPDRYWMRVAGFRTEAQWNRCKLRLVAGGQLTLTTNGLNHGWASDEWLFRDGVSATAASNSRGGNQLPVHSEITPQNEPKNGPKTGRFVETNPGCDNRPEAVSTDLEPISTDRDDFEKKKSILRSEITEQIQPHTGTRVVRPLPLKQTKKESKSLSSITVTPEFEREQKFCVETIMDFLTISKTDNRAIQEIVSRVVTWTAAHELLSVRAGVKAGCASIAKGKNQGDPLAFIEGCIRKKAACHQAMRISVASNARYA